MVGKIKKLLIVLCVLAICLFAFLQYQNRKTQTILDLTEDEKLSDFDTLCEILDSSYPFWIEAQQIGIDRDTLYKAYREEIMKTDTDIEFFKCIGYFLKEFKGLGHLSVLDGYMYGLYTDTLSMLSPQEKLKIGPLCEVLENEISSNTYSQLDRSHGGFRSIIGLKDEYRNKDTEQITQTPEIVTEIYENKAAYVKIDSFELTRYQQDEETLNAFYKEIADVPNLIIDLRDNSGGSDSFWQNLIVKPNAKTSLTSERYFLINQNDLVSNYISNRGIDVNEIDSSAKRFTAQQESSFTHYTIDTKHFEQSENPYKGDIWVLVDDTVYSSSENFAVFCKNTGFATLVGTATGGDGGADPILVSLPNSGLIVRFSVFYGLNANGTGNEAYGTEPDILIREDEDALQKCLDQIDILS